MKILANGLNNGKVVNFKILGGPDFFQKFHHVV